MLEADHGFQLARIPRTTTGKATIGSLAKVGGVVKGYDRTARALIVAIPFTPTGLGVGEKLVLAGVRHSQINGRAGTAVFTAGVVRLLADKVTVPISSPLIEGERTIVTIH